MSRPRIGVLGSAFDPPTLGHLDVLQQAADHFDRILLVPSASHAFSKKSQPFATRVALLTVFIDSILMDTPLEICDCEAHMLKRSPEQPVYTFDVLEYLDRHYQGGADLSFIRGPDNADPQVWYRFYKAEEIEQRWPLFTAQERVDVRSTQVRSLLASMPLNVTVADINGQLDDWLLPAVRGYIQQHKLYQGHL